MCLEACRSIILESGDGGTVDCEQSLTFTLVVRVTAIYER